MNTSFAQHVRQDFSRAAETYDQYAGLQRRVARDACDAFAPFMPAGARVVDAGCGTGYLAHYLGECGLDWRLIQLDLADDMVGRAAASGHPALCADMQALPLGDASVDGLFSSLCLQWVDNVAAAFQEAARVIRPGGHAVFTTFGPETLTELRQSFELAGLTPSVNDFPPRDALQSAMEASGLRVVACDDTAHHGVFDDAVSLMHYLKGLGATYKGAGHAPLTRGALDRIQQAYHDQFATEDGLPARFHILSFVLKRTA